MGASPAPRPFGMRNLHSGFLGGGERDSKRELGSFPPCERLLSVNLGKPTRTLTELSKHLELPVADVSLSFSVTNYL